MHINSSEVRLVTINKDGSAEILHKDQTFMIVPKEKVEINKEFAPGKENEHSSETINQIKKRLNNTTKGDWKFGVDGSLHSKETHEHLMYVGGLGDIVMKYVNMTFIEHAKSDIEFLLSEVERLNQVVKNNEQI